MIDNRDSLTETFSLFHVVRRDDDGLSFRAEFLAINPTSELPTRLRIQTGRWLVEEEELRVPTSAHATARRCFCPPDSPPTLASRFSPS